MTNPHRILAMIIASLLIAVTLTLAIAGILALNYDLSSIGGESPGISPPTESFQMALTGDLAKSFEDVITSLINAFKTVVMGFVELILSPIKAISSIFSGWAKTIGAEWYGPLLAVVIFGIIYILIRTFGLFDALLDRLG